MYTLNMEEVSISQRCTFQLVGGFLVNLAPEPKVALAGHVVYFFLRLLLATPVTKKQPKLASFLEAQLFGRGLIESNVH
jgi:hypothetical protein